MDYAALVKKAKSDVNQQLMIVRNRYVRRALAKNIPPEDVKDIFGLSKTALEQLRLAVRAGCRD